MVIECTILFFKLHGTTCLIPDNGHTGYRTFFYTTKMKSCQLSTTGFPLGQQTYEKPRNTMCPGQNPYRSYGCLSHRDGGRVYAPIILPCR